MNKIFWICRMVLTEQKLSRYLENRHRVIMKRKIGYVVHVDMQGFFNHIDHEWLMKFIELRIGSGYKVLTSYLLLSPSQAFFFGKGEVLTYGGASRGEMMSAAFANVYLHYYRRNSRPKQNRKRFQNKSCGKYMS